MSATIGYQAAFEDLWQGLRRWDLWTVLAWQDIRKRYRGSIIGPFWITFSMAIWVTTIGLLYANLFKQSLTDYLPFVSLGFLFWSLLSQFILEGCSIFIGAQGVLKQMKIPLSVFVYQSVLRNLIVFAHNASIFVVIALMFQVRPTVYSLLVLPALLAYALNGLAITILLATLCARFRDIPPIVSNLLQVVFFVTPIFWSPSVFGGRTYIYHANPVYHFIEIARAPMLGKPPSLFSWEVVMAVICVTWAAALFLYSRVRHRVVFWV